MLKTVGNPSTRSGDQTINNGDLIIGTAGDGIDFSANTPAAGMTSQLLDWYEEGTWTPTVTSSSGSITSYTVISANYTRIGRQVSIIFQVNITNAGTGAGVLSVTLPITNGSSIAVGCGTEYNNTVKMLQGYVLASAASISIVTYDNGSLIATNAQVFFSMTYFV